MLSGLIRGPLVRRTVGPQCCSTRHILEKLLILVKIVFGSLEYSCVDYIE